jgi:hypothetical protein
LTAELDTLQRLAAIGAAAAVMPSLFEEQIEKIEPQPIRLPHDRVRPTHDTDATMSSRAECVMLNKGPFVVDAVRFLGQVLRRMQDHQEKKRAMLPSQDIDHGRRANTFVDEYRSILFNRHGRWNRNRIRRHELLSRLQIQGQPILASSWQC